MQISPARIDQIQRGRDGKVRVIDADAGGVADELRRIHPGLKLRYNEVGEYFCVYYESEDGRDTYLILTAQECDHRIPRRLREIDSHGRSGYDYAQALETGSREAKRLAHERIMRMVEEKAPLAQWALRKDLGIKNRAFIPR